ncbi:hypothetical protein NIES4073_46210 [Kalymmatonema gypsitolerans NIES-4073]|nr:hypothetical protein [Scytonema sp. HK-05]BAY47369.1 hypothetical protein SAMD00079811_49870 [Scytonema sp. HK-05]BAZ23732.1 hypothetical protein NIES4073_46210 [Scytonema sp. NIES-4073]
MSYLNIEQLGKLARTIRKHAGLSQAEAAQIIGSCQIKRKCSRTGKKQ